MQSGKRFTTLIFVGVLTAGLMSGCGAEGGSNADSPTTTGATEAPSTTTVTTEPVADEGAEAGVTSSSSGADCFVDEDGHGPDCDEPAIDDCFVDAEGHGPDCDEESVGAPVDDCYIDAEGHGPDCDQGSVVAPVDDCFVDADGHGPDCGEEGLGGPDDLRYLTGWDADGTDLDVGTVFTLTCEPNGTPGGVWGTDPYSDDSSLCTAAAHAGKITVKNGGVVGGQRIDSRRTLPGGRSNGIDSQPADNWRGAIEFF